MLTQLQISNFTIIKQVTVEFGPHMNVLTGETGAGKSILIDAIGLILGARADSEMVGSVGNNCELFASFDISKKHDVQTYLQQHDLAADDDCILRRIINKDGRSRCSINGKPCTLQQLKELGVKLINIHGQHDQQTLLKSDKQRWILDKFGNHLKLSQQLKQLFQEWDQLNNQIRLLSAQDTERNQRCDFIRYQVSELQQLAVTAAEIQELNDKQKRLSHVEQLASLYQQAAQLLEDNQGLGLQNSLADLNQVLQQLCKIDHSLTSTAELIAAAQIHVQEASYDLHRFYERLELDPSVLQAIEQRLTSIHDLARKHRIDMSALPALQQQLEQELAKLDNHDEHLQCLITRSQTIKKDYLVVASELSRRRQDSAKKLIKLVNQHLKQLDLPNCLFDIKLTAVDDPELTSYGLEKVDFLIRSNPGQPFSPLAKIASGGELSRISLAIEVVTAEKYATPTLIFDEIDTGVSGSSAAMIGKLMQTLASETQVLCVTHLAQVAAHGHHHLRVSKSQDQQETRTAVTRLNRADSISELARLLGGLQITKKTEAHARELLETSFKDILKETFIE